MKRMLYAIQQARLKQGCLKKFLDPMFQCNTLSDLTPERLKALGIALLALDFDGVLAAHGEVGFRPEIQRWLESVQVPIFIISNKPTQKRIDFVKKNYPAIRFVEKMPKKPYPDSLLSLVYSQKLKAEHILMVDDRVLTGLLGACLAGCQGMWVCQPFHNFMRRPFVELFFEGLRRIEKAWLKWN